MCWCVRVLLCSCVDVLVCRNDSVGVSVWRCGDALVYWSVGIGVLVCWCVHVLVWWCVHVLVCWLLMSPCSGSGVLMCWSVHIVGPLMC